MLRAAACVEEPEWDRGTMYTVTVAPRTGTIILSESGQSAHHGECLVIVLIEPGGRCLEPGLS